MSTNISPRVCDDGWSEEYDCIPLRLRLKILHSTEHRKDDGNLTVETTRGCFAGDDQKQLIQTANCSSTVLELKSHQASDKTSSGYFVDYPGGLDLDGSFENLPSCSTKMPASESRTDVEQLNHIVGASIRQTTSDIPVNVLQDCLTGSNSANVQACDVKHAIFYKFDDALDNVLLKERRKMLISRKLKQTSRSDIGEHEDGGLSKLSKVLQQKAEECYSFDAQGSAIMGACALETSVLPLLAKVKDEPLDIRELWSEEKNLMQNSYFGQTLTVKNEPEFSDCLLDELDHLPLVDRVKLLSLGKPSVESVDVSVKPVFSKEDVSSSMDFGNDVLDSIKPNSICRPRKKRRTATDSVETALEEDAPGLLKILLERGVSAGEMKLYGEEDANDALDDSSNEDGFAELEAVISQLFSQRQTFMKFPLLRTKGVKISYCLSCLLSLVEQTRYLQNRKWPVEWGWCRDLQSFIFVFQRHNRIVLERPEYGFATYFFELLNSVPVAWQIKRLVIAMKLTGCGRITLIENKPLVVGEDLSDGEARVLAEYGWTPNTGLGSMLNYCDRVVHDRKQELDSSEWRLKIGKQLMNGYNSGILVAKNLPKRLMEYQDSQKCVQVKLEEELFECT